jgi:hypothetical protein
LRSAVEAHLGRARRNRPAAPQSGAFTSLVERKMIKTFSLSALFFMTLGILVASYATLPV